MPDHNPSEKCRLSFDHYRFILEKAKENNYKILTCHDYFTNKDNLPDRYIILRHDIEHYPERALEFAKIEAEFNVNSTYYVRVHAEKYNIFSFRAYNSLKKIISLGNEIGLHAEPIDFSKTSGEESKIIFQKELDVLKLVLECEVHSVCPHVDWTEYNNLDFFKNNDLKEFGLKFQAYAPEFYDSHFYVSDGQHYYWKNYKNGTLLEQRLCPCKIIQQGIYRLYVLTHPMNWFNTEFHLM